MFKCENCDSTFSSAIKYKKHGRFPCQSRSIETQLDSSKFQDFLQNEMAGPTSHDQPSDVLTDLQESVPQINLQRALNLSLFHL